MISFKSGCVFRVWSPALQWIFVCLVEIDKYGIDGQPEELVVTSVTDGVHVKNSRHYTNEAIDLRSKNFPSMSAKERFRLYFEQILNSNPLYPGLLLFRVLFEGKGTDNEHFHIQVAKGAQFPPA